MDHRMDHNRYEAGGTYETGPTKPPKSRNGLVALLLILVIFLCGIITLLGILNVKLFHQIKFREEGDVAISFSVNQTIPAPSEAAEPVPVQEEEEASAATLDLQQAPAAVENRTQEEGLSLQEIYTKNIPSVVSISTAYPGGATTGTGVIFANNGYIVTNAHVVENAASITVQLTDNRVLSADVVGMDTLSDLAVLYVDAQDLTPAQFGDSANLRVGDQVTAIGDPLGIKFRGTYTNGIISAINRNVDVGGYTMTLIQTNAALNAGNSGGPLINCYGQVIGINTMKIGVFADSDGVEGIGFAIPSATVKEITDQLVRQGYVSGRPTLGISGEALSVFYQHYYNLPQGLYISQVDRASDAYGKGVRSGDILVSINDTAITTMNELTAAVYNCQVGDRVTAIIYRSGEYYQLELTLSEDIG